MRQTEINGRWPIVLPDHRADFHEVKPWWEAARLADMYAWITQVFWEGSSIIDVGSEEGDFTALYASWGCDVSFIDPSRPWWKQTIETFEANGLQIPVSFCGLADNYNYIEGSPVDEKRFVTVDEKRVARITLDTFCEWFDFRPDAVTMDVEGSELRVLEGAPKLLTEDVVWWISIHGKVDPHAMTPSKVHAFMRECGFKDQWLGSLDEHHYRFWRP